MVHMMHRSFSLRHCPRESVDYQHSALDCCACALPGVTDERSAMAGLRGGELAGMERLRGFLGAAGAAVASTATGPAPANGRGVDAPTWSMGRGSSDGSAPSCPPPIGRFRERRMTASLDRDASAKLSAYLAIGCLSPRTVHAVLAAHRSQAGGRRNCSAHEEAQTAARHARNGGGAAGGHESRSQLHADSDAGGVKGGHMDPRPIRNPTAKPGPEPAELGCEGGKGGGRPGLGGSAAEVGAGAEPGPAPAAADGAETLGMHLQIRRVPACRPL